MPNKTNIIAIDPGASGGIASNFEGTVTCEAMPDKADLKIFFDGWGANCGFQNVTVYMEQVGGFIGKDGKNVAAAHNMFPFGRGFGFIEGVCAALEIKLVLVLPKVWQKGIQFAGSAKDKAERKRAYKEHAARMFPGLTVTLKTADALCLLEYAMWTETVNPITAPSPTLPPPNVAKPRKGARYSEAQAAIAWCKKNKWEVPLTGTAEFGKMINYYRQWLGGVVTA